MSNNTNKAIPGMYYPQTNGMPGGNPRDSSVQLMNAGNLKQANLNAAVGGQRKRKGKNGGAITVPQFQPLYQTGSNGPNQIIAENLATSIQSRANAANDSAAVIKKGGKSRRCKKGGNPDWVWGCYSGGKKYKTAKRGKKNIRKSRTSRRSRK